MSNQKRDGYTSLRINKALWKKAKIEAINQSIDVSQLVENSLMKELGITEEQLNKLPQ